MGYMIAKVYGNSDSEDLSFKLEEEVNKYIKEGWKPLGNIAIVPYNVSNNVIEGSYVEVWQSMIKE